MTYRTKLILLTLLPIVLVVIAIISVINFQSRQLEAQQAAMTKSLILQMKKDELLNYIELAENAIKPLYTSVLKDPGLAEREAAEILRKMTFGEDNYFFVYNGEGTNIVHPRLTYLVGKNWIGLKDKNGQYVIADLIKGAKGGGEFYSYIWQKPSTKEYVPKLAYSTYFSRWDWMLGTGIYLDDVNQKMTLVRQQLRDNIDQTTWVILALSLAGILATGAVMLRFQLSEQRLADSRLKALNARIVDVQEQERKRVAHDLHDGISQFLVSSRYGLEAALTTAGNKAAAKAPIETAMTSIDNALAEVRRISLALRPVALDDIGLAAAVKSLGSDFERDTGITVKVDATPVRHLLSDTAKTALYRVVQEALTNIAKHADANSVGVSLTHDSATVKLLIADDGDLTPEDLAQLEKSSGMGIQNMSERIASLEGQISFGKAKAGGLEIRTIVAVEKEPEKQSV